MTAVGAEDLTSGLTINQAAAFASVQDSTAGTQPLNRVAAAHPGLRKVRVDGGYRTHLVEHAARLASTSSNAPGQGRYPCSETVDGRAHPTGWLIFHRRLAGTGIPGFRDSGIPGFEDPGTHSPAHPL